MKILIVDSQTLFREGLLTMLRGQADMQVVGDAGSIKEAVEKVKATQPDLILMDLYFRDGDGFEAIKTFHGQYPEMKIVVLTASGSYDQVKAAVLNGAKGFLLKSCQSSPVNTPPSRGNSAPGIRGHDAPLFHRMRIGKVQGFGGILNHSVSSLTPPPAGFFCPSSGNWARG